MLSIMDNLIGFDYSYEISKLIIILTKKWIINQISKLKTNVKWIKLNPVNKVLSHSIKLNNYSKFFRNLKSLLLLLLKS